MKNVIIIVIFVASCNLYSQQDSQYTQYMYNTIIVNPAYAGSIDRTSINAVHRTQWSGLESAPTTQTFSISTPFGDKIGFGISGTNDVIGPSRQSTFLVDFAYKLTLNDSGLLLSLGTKIGVGIIDVDYGDLDIYDPSDVTLLTDVKKTSPKAGVGAYLYSKKWYLGLSTPNLLKSNSYSSENSSVETTKTHLYFIGGYVFDINENFKFKPAALMKYVKGAPVSVDLSANTMIFDNYIAGISYRLGDSVSFLMSVLIAGNLTLGYAYDINGTSLQGSGSHEAFIRYDITNRVKGRVSPRFF